VCFSNGLVQFTIKKSSTRSSQLQIMKETNNEKSISSSYNQKKGPMGKPNLNSLDLDHALL
jgi:hypothetical protein